jgi:hypothetical protein
VIFVDSNVLIDYGSQTGEFAGWSRRELALGRVADELATNHVVAAEISARFDSADFVLEFLGAAGVALKALDGKSAFRAGQAHEAYRRAGGPREAILADFLIGGHAAVLGARLLTRDRQRFATYFPELILITPETEHG